MRVKIKDKETDCIAVHDDVITVTEQDGNIFIMMKEEDKHGKIAYRYSNKRFDVYGFLIKHDKTIFGGTIK